MPGHVPTRPHHALGAPPFTRPLPLLLAPAPCCAATPRCWTRLSAALSTASWSLRSTPTPRHSPCRPPRTPVGHPRGRWAARCRPAGRAEQMGLPLLKPASSRGFTRPRHAVLGHHRALPAETRFPAAFPVPRRRAEPRRVDQVCGPVLQSGEERLGHLRRHPGPLRGHQGGCPPLPWVQRAGALPSGEVTLFSAAIVRQQAQQPNCCAACPPALSWNLTIRNVATRAGRRRGRLHQAGRGLGPALQVRQG